MMKEDHNVAARFTNCLMGGKNMKILPTKNT